MRRAEVGQRRLPGLEHLHACVSPATANDPGAKLPKGVHVTCIAHMHPWRKAAEMHDVNAVQCCSMRWRCYHNVVHACCVCPRT